MKKNGNGMIMGTFELYINFGIKSGGLKRPHALVESKY